MSLPMCTCPLQGCIFSFKFKYDDLLRKSTNIMGKSWKNGIKRGNFSLYLGKYHFWKWGKGQKYHILFKYSPLVLCSSFCPSGYSGQSQQLLEGVLLRQLVNNNNIYFQELNVAGRKNRRMTFEEIFAKMLLRLKVIDYLMN